MEIFGNKQSTVAEFYLEKGEYVIFTELDFPENYKNHIVISKF